MRAPFTAIFGGLVLCACSSSGEDETGTTTSTAEALCDGSDAQRVAATSGGGFVDPTYEFTNPYGFRFLFVDGGCRYFTSRSTLEGVRSGEVTASGALTPLALTPLALEGDLGWSELAAWSAHQDENCPDGGTTSITDGVSTAACSCGCDEDAPAGMNEVFEGFSGLVDTLAEAATPLDGPMQLLLVETLVDGAVRDDHPRRLPCADAVYLQQHAQRSRDLRRELAERDVLRGWFRQRRGRGVGMLRPVALCYGCAVLHPC